MFSVKEKQYIAGQIEKLLLSLNHPEMPKKNPLFHLRIEGTSQLSWAEIQPNWKFGINNPPSVNPFNEKAREILKNKGGEE